MSIKINENNKEIIVHSFIEAIRVMQEAEATGKDLSEYELKLFLPHDDYEAFINQGHAVVNAKDGTH